VTRWLLWLSVVLAVAVSVSRSQVVHSDTLTVRDTSSTPMHVISGDTLHLPPVPGKSPGLAMLLSGIVPGAGQVYNHSYWKAPIVLGLGVYFAAEFFANDRNAEGYRQLYLASIAANSNATIQTGYLDLREFYKNQRDAFAWYFFIVYVLNIVDAYVDASLYGFDVSPALSFHGPAGNAGLSLRFTW
jgi:hypothetical protein